MSSFPVFKTPKPLREGSQFSPQRSLFSPQRPKPSPLKSEILMRDLGLDDDDTLADISTPSDTDSESDETQPSEIEFRILQKELDTCSKQKDELKHTNMGLQKELQHLQTRLKREETSKRTRTKIMQKAHKESLRDKHNLILDLQDLIEEGGDHSSLKLVSSIEKLHDEKADLQNKLIEMQEEHVNKLNELEDQMQDGGTKHQNLNDSIEMQSLLKEQEALKDTLDKNQRKYVEENRNLERSLQDKEQELTKIKYDYERYKNSDQKMQQNILELQEELRSSKQTHHAKEKESSYMLKKQKEELKLLAQEKERLKIAKETVEAKMLSKLSNQESTSNEISNKLAAENQNLNHEIERLNRKTMTLESQVERLQDFENECLKLSRRNDELLENVRKLENSQEKHKTISKEKIAAIELELEESRSSLARQRKEAQENYEDLKKTCRVNEEELKQELRDAEAAQKRLEEKSEEDLKRLNEKLSKSNDKVKGLKSEIVILNSKVSERDAQIEELSEKSQKLTKQLEETNNKLQETQSNFTAEQKKVAELNDQLDGAHVEKENYERRLALLSGKSTSALAEKEKESGELRMEVNKMQHVLQAEKRKNNDLNLKNKEMQRKFSELEIKLSEEQNAHQKAIESTKESHKHAILKFKATTAITSQELKDKTATLQKSIRLITTALKQMSHDNALLRKEALKFPEMIKQAAKLAGKQISEAVTEMNENSKDLVRKYRKEMKLRKKYHNELVELRGNIRVFVRARPRISEDGPSAKMMLTYDVNDDAVVTVNNTQRGRLQTFELDRVFADDSSQEEVYKEVQALVTSCMDGYHVCIFAYGQTGSGKTYTMEGTAAKPGINQRALADLFAIIEDRSADWSYTIAVSLVEIYNEALRDLLSSASQQKLDIKMNVDGSLFVQGLTSRQVNNLDDVNKVFETGKLNRATASTNMNEHSSRSHAVLMVTVSGVNKTTGVESFGKLNLIDLAGSERVSKSGASGDRLKEAQNINKSLSSLGDVIHALRNKQSHVPFRNSKLTYLLQDSLSKDSKTLMVVQVSPVDKNVSETICSLTFAQRVRLVELGQAAKKTK
uniref:Kinesin-like protein KIFC3 n=1 Tax=Phallusia mammillata TaxID=59560 RepID=A0A6F9DG27_9ASCI|nr:kinesin-like protein KIFC3 [Phallusia mammillata]